MQDGRADISILLPFTQDQIESYVSFLRKNGEVPLARAVEAEVEKHPGFMLQDGDQRAVKQH